MDANILINILWPWLAFFAAIALGRLWFNRPHRRRPRRRRW